MSVSFTTLASAFTHNLEMRGLTDNQITAPMDSCIVPNALRCPKAAWGVVYRIYRPVKGRNGRGGPSKRRELSLTLMFRLPEGTACRFALVHESLSRSKKVLWGRRNGKVGVTSRSSIRPKLVSGYDAALRSEEAPALKTYHTTYEVSCVHVA